VPVLQVKDLRVWYGAGEFAVDQANLVVNRGEVVVVAGPNGAGKSSLLKAIAGYTRGDGVRTQGEILVNGQHVLGRDPSDTARLGVCFIPERDKVFRNLTVDNNLRLLAQRRRNKKGASTDLEQVFELFPWIRRRGKTLAGYLSGGEQQMLAISGLVLARPDLVLVDEPSLGLAPIMVREVMSLLGTLRSQLGLTLLLVDQNVRATSRIADRMLAMEAGRLIEDGVGTSYLPQLGATESNSTMYPRRPSPTVVKQPPDSSEGSKAILSVDSVSLAFGGLKALDNVSFSIEQGELVGLVGPNGAGKTALLNCITGFYRPDRGEVRFLGRSLVGRPPSRVASYGISRTFQHAAKIQQIGSRDVMLVGGHRSLPSGVLRYLTPIVRQPEKNALLRATQICDELGIGALIADNTPFELLPYGTRKLVDLGRALMGDPRILIMDEPAAGLNSDEKQLMFDAIMSLGQRRNIGLIVVEHDLAFVSSMSDRLIVLDAGRVVADGTVDVVLQRQDVIECYVGIEDVS
jgi:ABC-type branched-subunit amino acid transport system ATPase component